MSWFDFFKSRRKSPTSVIENVRRPGLESAYIKFPGKNIRNISKKRRRTSVYSNGLMINKLLREEGKDFLHAHTHPYIPGKESPNVLPSDNDWNNFLNIRKNQKTMIIAQQNGNTGEVEGYFIMRKTKNTQKNIDKAECFQDIRSYSQSSNYYLYTWLCALAEKYNIQYRFVPAEGYKFDRISFVPKEGLENKVAKAVSLSGFGSGTVLLSSNITGNVIGNLNQISLNWIGGVLFVVGLIAGFFWLKKRKLKIEKIKQNRKRKK